SRRYHAPPPAHPTSTKRRNEEVGMLDQQLQSPPTVPPTAPPTAQEVAQRAADTMTPTERQELAANVVQGLDTAEQQKARAEGVVNAVPNEARQDLAASVVHSLDTPEQRQIAAERALGALPTDQQQQVARSVLGQPDGRTQQRLWYIVIWTMTAAIFVFGLM